MKENLFVNKFDKEFKNNEKVFYSKGSNITRSTEKVDVKKQISDIFKANDFVYKADVTITTKDKKFNLVCSTFVDTILKSINVKISDAKSINLTKPDDLMKQEKNENYN